MNEDDSLLDARYIRWQGLSIAQFTVAISLLSAWSAGAMVYGVSVLRGPDLAHHVCSRGWLIGSIVVLLISSALSFLAVVSRTLDFKLTARKVRKTVLAKRGCQYAKPLVFLSLSSDDYGRITWFLFAVSALLFAAGMLVLSITIGTNLDILK